MKNCKKFYEAYAASRLKEVIQPSPTHPPPDRPYRDIQKYTDICFQSASRMQFLGVKKWCSANVFSDTKQKHLCWKICKVKKVLAVLGKHIIFNVK